MAHEANPNGEPFDPKNVPMPHYDRKPHTKSVPFAKHVSTRPPFYFFFIPNLPPRQLGYHQSNLLSDDMDVDHPAPPSSVRHHSCPRPLSSSSPHPFHQKPSTPLRSQMSRRSKTSNKRAYAFDPVQPIPLTGPFHNKRYFRSYDPQGPVFFLRR